MGSVVITDAGFFTIPVNKHIPSCHDIKENNITLFEFRYSAQGTGDGTGGVVLATMDFGALNEKAYYCITGIHTYQTDSHDVRLKTETDRWDNLYFPGHASKEINLFVYDGNFTGFFNRDQVHKLIYLGRPRSADSDKGKINIEWASNTNTSVYNATILGYALAKPLPLSHILR